MRSRYVSARIQEPHAHDRGGMPVKTCIKENNVTLYRQPDQTKFYVRCRL